MDKSNKNEFDSEVLAISDQILLESDFERIVYALKSKQIKSLQLKNVQLNDQGLTKLTDSIAFCDVLESLDLSENIFSAEKLKILLDKISYSKIMNLTLNSSKLTTFSIFEHFLSVNSSLKYLSLASSRISSEALRVLVEFMLSNPNLKLQSLDLTGNRIMNHSMEFLLNLASKMHSLTTIVLRSNPITSAKLIEDLNNILSSNQNQTLSPENSESLDDLKEIDFSEEHSNIGQENLRLNEIIVELQKRIIELESNNLELSRQNARLTEQINNEKTELIDIKTQEMLLETLNHIAASSITSLNFANSMTEKCRERTKINK